MIKTIKPDIATVAQRLWKDGIAAEPNIEAVYLFPSDTEIRLVYLDRTAMPSPNDKAITPFYFGANAANGAAYPSAIALIRPEEKDTLRPPRGWGDWSQAQLVWEA